MANNNNEKLRQFREELAELNFPESPISLDLVEYVRDALDAYLSGDVKTLDQAFGIARGKGRTKETKKHRQIALQALRKRFDGLTWGQIMEDIKDVSDERTLRRIVDEHQTFAMTQILTERLNQPDP